jgi:hypothetical protein
MGLSARLRKINIICFLSYLESRPKKKDMNIKWDCLEGNQWGGRTKEERDGGEYGQRTLYACTKVE